MAVVMVPALIPEKVRRHVARSRDRPPHRHARPHPCRGAEVATLQAELNGILGWIEQLNEVNVDGIEPLTGAAQMALKMREDVVTDGGYPDKVLANAPERAGDFFAVPKVVE